MQFTTSLRNPAILVAFTGWNDAAAAASDLLEKLITAYPGTDLDPIDDEQYFDYQATRPMLNRSPDGPWIQWPTIRVRVVHHPQRDLVVFLGPEPSLRWRSFTQELVGRIAAFEPELVIFLGAMLSDTPHTRPMPVGFYTSDPRVEKLYAVQPSDYTGPTGIIGVTAQAMLQHRLPAASLWVSVPHYVAAPPNPKAQLALSAKLETVLGVAGWHEELPQEAQRWSESVDELSRQDPEIADYIAKLEEARDAELADSATGDAIAAELERFLRQQGEPGSS